MKTIRLIAFSLASLMISASLSFAQEKALFSPEDIDVPYKKYVLDNGLRLLVHEDHKAPIVAVNVWYHVGSKNEKQGKSGFAHLFEHLMFNGSENYNDDYFQALERIGGTDLNGTTNHDRTNYFQNVPTAALEQVLFLESDRMGHLLGAIDQAKLDEQRGVVQNEKRQGENQPYGRMYELVNNNSFPKGHPYSWTVIGSMDDLNAASLEDVQEWFKTYYGPNNAVLSIAGDVDPDDIFEKVKKYFGDIPPGPTLAKPEVDLALRTGEKRFSFEDRVPEARISMNWNVPQWGTKEAAYLDLASDILTSGKNARLYKKLVYDEQIASSVWSYIDAREIAGVFNITTNVKPGESVENIEATVAEVLETLITDGPKQEEIDRVKSQYFASAIKGLERIGGFGGKSDILANHEVYGGSPDTHKEWLKWVSEATAEDIHNTVKKYLSDGKLTVVATPFPNFTASGEGVDRSQLPPLGKPVAASFPDIQKAELKNGMKVVLAQRKGVPTVVMNMMFDAGYATDKASQAGLASLAMNMMDEGTSEMNSLQINEKLQTLGASVNTYSDLDNSYISMNTLKPSFDASLDIYSQIVLSPAFPEGEFERLKKEQLINIQRQKSSPIQLAIRVMPKFLYGEGHAYSMPLQGSGYENTVSSLTKADMENFYKTWIKPNNATVVVVGDIEMSELKSKLEERFGKWKKGDVPTKNIPMVKATKGNTLYLMDRPESQQSVIIAGYLTSPYGKIDEIAKESMLNVLGGDFTSRLNMNLREDKHWAYGAGAFVINAKGQRPMLAYAPVQTDKTKESAQEIVKEFKMFVGDKPITKEEFEKTRGNTILQLPGQWETNGSVASSLNNYVKYKLSDDYYKTYDQKVRNLTLEEVQKLSKQVVLPENLNWFVVGDKEKILSSLEEVGFDEIVILDGDGNPIQPEAVKMKSEGK
ncbi:pitrilysin family protein [Flammeovirgaceae bacterium SG7u.111]|nr:pitrilysin family protein [Flammeovirgaceae bacterium SG7u.132]WPO34607.1 pitrilysin family protein [Flammeovirgaceae bacterium SG7u.111]